MALRRGRMVAVLPTVLVMLALLPAHTPAAEVPGSPGRPAARIAQRSANAPDADQPAEEAEQEPQEVELPKIDEMQVPTAAELLHGERRDWIVFKTDEVLVCEPVYPRPRTLEKMQAAIDEYPSYSGPREPEALKRYRARFDELHHLNIQIPDDPQPYRLHMGYVAEILHHEDLMLRRADRLMDEGKFDEAYEVMFVVARRYEQWPGLEERRHRLLFLEAEDDLKNGRSETALVTLESLHEADSNYPGLRNQLGKVADELIAAAVGQRDFRRARHFLMRLRRKEPQHAVATQWIDKLLDRATERINRAGQLYEQKRYADAARLADQAASIWPNAPGLPAVPNLRTLHHRIHSRFPRLKVGVVRLPGEPTAYFPPDNARRRHRQLTRIGLFEIDHSDDAPHYRSGLLEQWEPTDLGRRAVFTLRQNRAYWEPQPVVTASSVLSAIADRIAPSSPRYDAHFASYVESAAMLSPFRFEVRFARVPLRTESLFTFPVVEPSSSAGEPEIVSKRFVVHERTPERIVYRRANAEPDRAERFHVAEIIERKYATYDKAVQGLLRGEVSMLPHVQSWDVPQLAADGRFAVLERALPVTHLVLFNPKSPFLKHRELRRALAYAIDREQILGETVLRDPLTQRGRVITGPFPTRGLSGLGREVPGYAYNIQVDPWRSDPLLAVSLALAAEKQLGQELPQLRLVCDPDPIARTAARRLIESWSRAGMDVALIPDDEPLDPGSSDWDLLYRTVTLTDPAAQLWPLLTSDPAARVPSLEFLPDWLRQELIDLDRAGDWDTAVRLLHRIHEHLAAEVQLIPLWEVDDYFVVRRTIGGYPDPPMRVYHDVQRWIVNPWFPEETP